jgi:hypothetical protein
MLHIGNHHWKLRFTLESSLGGDSRGSYYAVLTLMMLL